MTEQAKLARRLGTFDAVVIGLGSMIGAGVFAAFAPAAGAAGALLLVGLALAAGVAYCNAVASAQLAAQYPTSGGTYVYGRERLGEWWGFLAGWGFVIGKTASCAAMALTFAAYAVPGPRWLERLVAALAVVTLTGVNLRGITRTAGLTRILVAVSLVALAIVVGVILGSGDAGTGNLTWELPHGLYGVLQSAGLLFFAFAGYARIATLGEEVRDPRRTIPRAIPLALGITIAVYAVVAASVLLVLGPDELAASVTPLESAVRSVGADWAVPVVDVGAAVASLGALLALIAGIGRHDPRNGPGRRPPALALLGPSALPRAGPRRARSRSRGHDPRPDHRPARCDRVLVVRRAHVLRDRERIRVDATRRVAPLAACAERDRARRLRDARGHASVQRGRRRALDIRSRPRVARVHPAASRSISPCLRRGARPNLMLASLGDSSNVQPWLA